MPHNLFVMLRCAYRSLPDQTLGVLQFSYLSYNRRVLQELHLQPSSLYSFFSFFCFVFRFRRNAVRLSIEISGEKIGLSQSLLLYGGTYRYNRTGSVRIT